ncbi:MAG: hypothetical protein ACPGOV_09530 [Magnetovibrionaceae bacterium]
MHKRIVEPALARLDPDRATYFSEVAHRLEGDSRAQEDANLVFSVLAASCGDLPPHLPIDDFINRLLVFTGQNKRSFLRVLYSRAYLHNPNILQKHTKGFVAEVIGEVMRRGAEGELDHDEPQVYTFGPGDDPSFFPYADPDEDDEEDVWR